MSVAEVPAESPLRAAFIGISHDHAWGKAEAIRRSPHMDLVGAFEPDAAEWERQRARAQFSDVRHLAARDVLEAPTIEVVFIETRPHDNLRWAREALVHDLLTLAHERTDGQRGNILWRPGRAGSCRRSVSGCSVRRSSGDSRSSPAFTPDHRPSVSVGARYGGV